MLYHSRLPREGRHAGSHHCGINLCWHYSGRPYPRQLPLHHRPLSLLHGLACTSHHRLHRSSLHKQQCGHHSMATLEQQQQQQSCLCQAKRHLSRSPRKSGRTAALGQVLLLLVLCPVLPSICL